MDKTFIFERLKNISNTGYVTGAEDIIDDTIGKSQSQINSELYLNISDINNIISSQLIDLSISPDSNNPISNSGVYRAIVDFFNQNIIIDLNLSLFSRNPVLNKSITYELNKKPEKIQIGNNIYELSGGTIVLPDYPQIDNVTIDVDSELNDSSNNPVENRVIYAIINNIQELINLNNQQQSLINLNVELLLLGILDLILLLSQIPLSLDSTIKHIFLEEDEYNQLEEIEDNAIYFIYKPWGFGDKFPIILGDKNTWKFGDKFPIVLGENELEFPIELT